MEEKQISEEELNETINIYSKLLDSDEYKYLLKDIKEVKGEDNKTLRGCVNFETYKYREGVIDGIELIMNLPNKMIAQAKFSLEELNKEK